MRNAAETGESSGRNRDVKLLCRTTTEGELLWIFSVHARRWHCSNNIYVGAHGGTCYYDTSAWPIPLARSSYLVENEKDNSTGISWEFSNVLVGT